MSDQIDELIKEIATKHHIMVGRDDPILILHTINARLMNDDVKAHQAILTDYQATMSSVSIHWEKEVKRKAEQVLNTALTASKTVMDQQLQTSAEVTATLVRKEVENALARVDVGKKIAFINIAAASITLAAAIVLFFLK